jgi:hypothetical protein
MRRPVVLDAETVEAVDGQRFVTVARIGGAAVTSALGPPGGDAFERGGLGPGS